MRALESLEDFTRFVFLHMGYVDGSLHPIEKDAIIEKLNALFPGHPHVEGELLRLETEYRALGSGAAEALIKSGSAAHFHIDPNKKREIYAALFDIINANGRIHSEETHTLRMLKSWLMPE